MAEMKAQIKVSELECCPELRRQPVCDTLNLRYLLPFRARVADDKQWVIPVEVILHFRFERCSEGLVIGDPVYSTTLLPGEQVRLFTSDRHTRWSYDSESNLSYRHAATSVESFFTAGMAQAMSDLTINEAGVSASSFEESWAESASGGGFSFFGLFGVSGGSSSGSYDSQSMSAFAHSLSRHAESASRYVATSVRAKSAVSIGEVERRTHAEGESEAHYESSSRMFSNPNRCRAVTYLFYQINKLQRIRFRLVAIERRIVDPAAPTGAYQRVPSDTTGKVAVLPQSIPATSKNRLEVERMARTSAAERYQAVTSGIGYVGGTQRYSASRGPSEAVITPEPISVQLRDAALSAVDKDLSNAGILDAKTHEPTTKIVAELSWEREEVLPTPGVLVKGCLDQCSTCEPALQKEIELDLDRKELENQMLKRQIELLDQSQEYRCCPAGSKETVEPSDE